MNFNVEAAGASFYAAVAMTIALNLGLFWLRTWFRSREKYDATKLAVEDNAAARFEKWVTEELNRCRTSVKELGAQMVASRLEAEDMRRHREECERDLGELRVELEQQRAIIRTLTANANKPST